MEKIEKYRDCIKQVLTKYAAYKPFGGCGNSPRCEVGSY